MRLPLSWGVKKFGSEKTIWVVWNTWCNNMHASDFGYPDAEQQNWSQHLPLFLNPYPNLDSLPLELQTNCVEVTIDNGDLLTCVLGLERPFDDQGHTGTPFGCFTIEPGTRQPPSSSFVTTAGNKGLFEMRCLESFFAQFEQAHREQADIEQIKQPQSEQHAA
jgi:hypothetical protein